MISLPDVNVLIALAWPNHVHHAAAWVWFKANRKQGWATCPLTEAGFVRVSCNPSVVRHTVTPLDAIAVLERLTQLGPTVSGRWTGPSCTCRSPSASAFRDIGRLRMPCCWLPPCNDRVSWPLWTPVWKGWLQGTNAPSCALFPYDSPWSLSRRHPRLARWIIAILRSGHHSGRWL